MAQYINKDALVEEIERLIDKGKYHEEYYCAYRDGNNSALYALKLIINTLEVKEVDLVKEINDYMKLHHLHIKDGGRIVFENDDTPNFMCDFRDIAKHFFELGLKAKGAEGICKIETECPNFDEAQGTPI